MKARRCRSALVALLALVFVLLPGVAAIAADKAAPKAAAGNIADRWVLWPKPGEAKAFEAGVREHAAWRKKAGEPFTWVMYQPIAGSDLTYYVIRSDNHAWKDFDAEEAWSTKAKAEEAYQQQLGMHVAREEHYYEETDTAHSHWIDSKDYKYVGVTSWRLKPGARGDLMVALDVMPMKSYAEMADPDPSVRALLAKSLGSEDAAGATLKQFGGALEDTQYTVFAYRPDLAAQ
jgi:hypothetical protein